MDIQEILSKPIWQMTGEELVQLHKYAIQTTSQTPAADTENSKRYVYGIPGISQLFGCSIPTANRIKKSGRIDKAITQIGRKIIVDADLALQLAGKDFCNHQ